MFTVSKLGAGDKDIRPMMESLTNSDCGFEGIRVSSITLTVCILFCMNRVYSGTCLCFI